MTSPTIQQKWTPGPWEAGYGASQGEPTMTVVATNKDGSPRRTVCHVTPMAFADALDGPNARLIAAAPEMYDLLDEFLTDLNCVSVPDKAAPRLQCDCWKCVFANRVYALMKRIKGE